MWGIDLGGLRHPAWPVDDQGVGSSIPETTTGGAVREEELLPDDVDPEVVIDDPLEPVPDYGEHEEEAQLEEWEEDAREGGV